jgi:hypothetical protein
MGGERRLSAADACRSPTVYKRRPRDSGCCRAARATVKPRRGSLKSECQPAQAPISCALLHLVREVGDSLV